MVFYDKGDLCVTIHLTRLFCRLARYDVFLKDPSLCVIISTTPSGRNWSRCATVLTTHGIGNVELANLQKLT